MRLSLGAVRRNGTRAVCTSTDSRAFCQFQLVRPWDSSARVVVPQVQHALWSLLLHAQAPHGSCRCSLESPAAKPNSDWCWIPILDGNSV